MFRPLAGVASLGLTVFLNGRPLFTDDQRFGWGFAARLPERGVTVGARE